MTTWLIDKSAVTRLPLAYHIEEWVTRIRRGLVHITTPTLLELGYSARSAGDWTSIMSAGAVEAMPVEHITPAGERRTLQVQGLLAQRGLHRAPSVPDLLIAATAEAADLTVLHLDKGFDLIAEVTGQPTEWLRLSEPMS